MYLLRKELDTSRFNAMPQQGNSTWKIPFRREYRYSRSLPNTFKSIPSIFPARHHTYSVNLPAAGNTGICLPAEQWRNNWNSICKTIPTVLSKGDPALSGDICFCKISNRLLSNSKFDINLRYKNVIAALLCSFRDNCLDALKSLFIFFIRQHRQL